MIHLSDALQGVRPEVRLLENLGARHASSGE
jgi:hypothetical protein